MDLETLYRIEPCLLETVPTALADVISDVVGAATQLGERLHPRTAASLAELVRVDELLRSPQLHS